MRIILRICFILSMFTLSSLGDVEKSLTACILHYDFQQMTPIMYNLAGPLVIGQCYRFVYAFVSLDYSNCHVLQETKHFQ